VRPNRAWGAGQKTADACFPGRPTSPASDRLSGMAPQPWHRA
jgi:hypothetical protein